MSADGELTFAEAMALAPGEVETQFKGEWIPLLSRMRDPLDVLRACYFRRAKPKRSRVQEMAETGDTFGNLRAEWMTTGIRAVCEWLRAESRRGFERNPAAIEREFMEPR